MSRNLSENDEIIVPNVPVIAAITRIDNIVKAWTLDSLLKSTSSEEFKRLTENEFIWGYSDRFLSAIKTIMNFLNDGISVEQFGILRAVF